MSKTALITLHLFLLGTGTCAPRCAFGIDTDSSQAMKVYVESLGPTEDAIFLREKLVLRLRKSNQMAVVNDRQRANLIVSGTASIRVVGYFNSNPRVRYRNVTSVRVYDARMELEVKDNHGGALWSGKLKPRFWGSQYVSDNLVNQAVQRVVKARKNGQIPNALNPETIPVP